MHSFINSDRLKLFVKICSLFVIFHITVCTLSNKSLLLCSSLHWFLLERKDFKGLVPRQTLKLLCSRFEPNHMFSKYFIHVNMDFKKEATLRSYNMKMQNYKISM